jgi:CheY-like chemotaxis protein
MIMANNDRATKATEGADGNSVAAENASSAQASQAAPAQKFNQDYKPVLVIEDSMPLRRMMVKILSTQKLSGVEAENGQKAMEKLLEFGPSHFGMIVCDLMMPVMDGANFIANARKQYAEELPPVVVCSSRSDREAIAVVAKLGVAGYVLKPFKTETVINKLREVLKMPAKS